MKKAHAYIRSSLKGIYPDGEIDSFYYLILKSLIGFSRSDAIINAHSTLDLETYDRFVAIVERLKINEPLQYVLGETEFYGLPFKVNPCVLIPRNETEELVDQIIKDFSNSSPKILDFGTGSGCIPIALKKFLPTSVVYSCDISDDALNVAKLNATINNVSVEFFHFDILSGKTLNYSELDVIVSNPPYVTMAEIEFMNKNVLDYEPHLALFVPNSDPLLFYRTIVEKYAYLLKDNGFLYFEINEAFANETQEMLHSFNFNSIVINDINGKKRMVKAGRKLIV